MSHKIDKKTTARTIIDINSKLVEEQKIDRINAIWLESTGCAGNVISFLNAENPSYLEVITRFINLKFSNSLMAAEGNHAYEIFLDTLKTDFILIVDGAVSMKDNGITNIMANYKGRPITILEAVKMAGEKAKFVIAAGTCASYGGISAAKPNIAECKSVSDVLSRPVIRVPGCPAHPDWIIGTIATLVSKGTIELDMENRPKLFYSLTVHDSCSRRGYYEKGIFAANFGEQGCMFKLGCKGPVTNADCPRRKWNGYVNFPVNNNANCIGCTNGGFPDVLEPFIKY